MKLQKIIKIGLIVVVGGFIALEFICNQKEECKCSAYSVDKTSAISEGFYIDTYEPLRKSYVISNLKDSIFFGSGWSEHTWQFSKGLCLLRHKVKGDGFNICVPFSTTNSHINTDSFALAPIVGNKIEEGISSYFGGRINYGVDKLSDTIKLILRDKTKIDPQSEYEKDTVFFVKTKSSK